MHNKIIPLFFCLLPLFGWITGFLLASGTEHCTSIRFCCRLQTFCLVLFFGSAANFYLLSFFGSFVAFCLVPISGSAVDFLFRDALRFNCSFSDWFRSSVCFLIRSVLRFWLLWALWLVPFFGSVAVFLLGVGFLLFWTHCLKTLGSVHNPTPKILFLCRTCDYHMHNTYSNSR